MENIRNPPFCYACDGAGILYSNLEELNSYPEEKKCTVCNGTGIDLKTYNINQYRGELIFFQGRLGLFLKQINRNRARVLIGSRVKVVSSDKIEFINLRQALPTKGDLSFL